jgi:HSP20 family protein
MTSQDNAVPARRPLFPDLDTAFGSLRDLRWPLTLDSLRPLFEREAAAVDMFERDGKVVVKAELPGIKREDIEVNISDGQIAISGERREEEETKEEDYYRSERTYGRIVRTLVLPKGCDTEGAVAEVKDGVLEVVIPKHADSTTKKVEVKSA